MADNALHYGALAWKAFAVASLIGASTLALGSLLTGTGHWGSMVNGALIIALPQAWTIRRTFPKNSKTLAPQAAIIAVWVKFGLCAIGFAWVFNQPGVQAGSVFAGFLVFLIAFTAGNSWVALRTHND